MAKVFVSHSQHDRDIRAAFDSVFARTNVLSVCMEFEETANWQTIMNEVKSSIAVFLLLGHNIRGSIYTQNWIAFEVGLACASDKDVWVFEQEGTTVDFPIPYLTDYMVYNLNERSHFDYVRSIIERYGQLLPLTIGRQLYRESRGVPKGIPIICDACSMQFSLHTNITNILCPFCRKVVHRK